MANQIDFSDDETEPTELSQQLADAGPSSPSPNVARTPAGLAAAPQPAAAPLNPMLAKYLQGKQEMAAAQAQARQNHMFAGLARAGGMLGHAIAGGTDKLDESGYDELDKGADTPVAEAIQKEAAGVKDVQDQNTILDAQKNAEANDPNSAVSIASRKVYGKILSGMGLSQDAINNLPAASIDAYMKNPIEAKAKLTELENVAKEKNQSRRDAQSEKAASKASDEQMKTFQKLSDSADNFRGNQAVGQANKNLLAAQNALSMVTGKNLDHLSEKQIALFNDELAKIATGGVPGEHGVQMLMPDNLATKIASMQNYLTSNPSPAKAGAYLRDNIEYLKELQKNSQGMVDEFRRNRLFGAKARLTPDQVKDYKEHYNLIDQAPVAAGGGFPRTVTNAKTGHTATVSSAAELKEANDEGFH